MNIQLQKIEKGIVEWLPFLVCLIILPSSTPVGVFAVPKHISLILGLFLIVLLRAFYYQQGLGINTLTSIGKQPLVIKLILIIIPIIFAINIFSYNPLVSLFGAESLQTGLFFWATCLITLWVTSRTGSYKPSLKPAIYALIVISIITLTEALGFRPLLPITEKYITLHAPYPMATVGYRGHLAGLLAYLSLIPLVFFKDYTSWKFLSVFSLGMIALSCSSNTSALLGVFLALLLALIIIKKKQSIIPIVLFLVFMKFTAILAPVNNFLYSHHIVSQKLTSKDLSNPTTFKTRLYLWKSAFGLFKNRPIIGWGIDNYNMLWYTILSKADGDKLLKLEFNVKDEKKFSRINDSMAYKDSKGKVTPVLAYYYSSHSSTFDILYGQGMIGIVLYILFISAIIRQLYKNLQSRLFIIPALAYFVYLQAWFPTITNMAMFSVLLGIALSYSYNKEEKL